MQKSRVREWVILGLSLIAALGPVATWYLMANFTPRKEFLDALNKSQETHAALLRRIEQTDQSLGIVATKCDMLLNEIKRRP